MGKRKYVEAGLHSELSGYSSLLRALRTTDTLDLASQLTLPDAQGSGPTSVSRDDVYEDDDDDISAIADPAEDGHAADPAATSSSQASSVVQPGEVAPELPSPPSPSSRSSHPKASHSLRPATIRDTWTKWPLVPSEVHTPEWPFDDEIRLLAEDVWRRQSPLSTSEIDDGQEQTSSPDGPDDLQVQVTPITVHALARVASKRLHEILAACCAMLPEGEDSMQNRHGYINWELVLSAVSGFGMFKPEQLEDIKQRMLVLYPKYKKRRLHDSYAIDLASQRAPAQRTDFLDLGFTAADFKAPGAQSRTVKRKTSPKDGQSAKPEPSHERPRRRSAVQSSRQGDNDEWVGSRRRAKK
ncbi:hypothetical protein EIP91_010858 [Steccherinum ochraceum]|uniref:Uncharacterized protein n=1 Tax=Steccherinum ochraceum TaxID=92696 RepID=A0A4V2MUV2_9APHY|nr:hypothetical protein EIP91_010858 [Steccherinum ochraceum]